MRVRNRLTKAEKIWLIGGIFCIILGSICFYYGYIENKPILQSKDEEGKSIDSNKTYKEITKKGRESAPIEKWKTVSEFELRGDQIIAEDLETTRGGAGLLLLGVIIVIFLYLRKSQTNKKLNEEKFRDWR